MKNKKWLIHAIAHCEICNFEEDNYLTARKLGIEHYKKTGHTVSIETGYCEKFRKD